MKLQHMLALILVGICAGCSAGTDTKAADAKAAEAKAAEMKAQDEADIKALEARFVAAFKAKDVTAIMANYVADQSLIVFDLTPPRQYTGADAYTKDWQGYLTAFAGPWDMTMSDLDITVGGDVAYGHNVQHGVFTDKAGKKLELTVRVTDGYKKVNGKWLISHEHVSIPVDMDKMKPELNSK